MKYEDLVGYQIVDVVTRSISGKKGLVLMKGDELLLLEPQTAFDVSDLKIRSGDITKIKK